MNALSIEEVLDRGATVEALIESGWQLYFGEPIGMELLGLIAAADARRDVRERYVVIEALPHSALDYV